MELVALLILIALIALVGGIAEESAETHRACPSARRRLPQVLQMLGRETSQTGIAAAKAVTGSGRRCGISVSVDVPTCPKPAQCAAVFS